MPGRAHLANPAFEPSDDELEAWMRESFAGLVEARAESLRVMRARIAVMQAEARARFQARGGIREGALGRAQPGAERPQPKRARAAKRGPAKSRRAKNPLRKPRR